MLVGNIMIFLIEILIIVLSILCIKFKKYMFSIGLMVLLLCIHIVTNWNNVFFIILYIKQILK